MPIDESKTEFKCIYMPADVSKPIEERTVPIPKGETISSMISYVKEHIMETEKLRKAGLSRESLRNERSSIGQQLTEQIKKNPQLQGLVLTDDLIDRIYLSHAVDTVTLLPHCIATNYKGVIMYVDDQGVSKKLPRNSRATSLCFAVGNQTEVLGDCFIASIIDDNDDDFIRLDMGLKQLDDKEWLIVARGINTGKIKQQMAYLDVCKALQMTPQPSLLTKDKNKIDTTTNPDGTSTTTTTTTGPEKDKTTTEVKTDTISREITGAYSQGNKPLRDKTNLCAHGHLNCEEKASLRCSRCKNIYYCTATHQKTDWKRHKGECTAPPTTN